jgi:uncharacterized protein (TIGR00251 family)
MEQAEYPCLKAQPQGIRLSILVQPRASRTEICGMQGDRLKVRVSGPPVEGKANAAVIKFFAKQLHIAKSSIEIVGGEHARQKDLLILGATPESLCTLIRS